MEIIDRIVETLEMKRKLAIDLCRVLNISTSTFSTWKSRHNDPPANYMPTIANFLEVSLDYLLTGVEPPKARTLSQQELDLLDLFAMLPVEKRYEFVGEIKGFLKAMEDSGKYADQNKRLSG